MEEFCGRTPACRWPAPASFRQLFCWKESFLLLSPHSCTTAREAASRPKILVPFIPDVGRLCVHSTPRARIVTCLFLSSWSRRDPSKWRQSVYFVAPAIFQLRFQRICLSCCGLSCPSTQLPIESHEVVCLLKLSAECLFRNQSAP